MMLIRLLFLTLFFTSPLLALHVLIIGGGPAGLATALAAAEGGAQVTVVEKRSDYTRQQWLFLENSSIDFLGKWKVDLPEMVVGQFEGKEFALVQIKYLEQMLDKRARALGIQRISGVFTGIDDGNIALIATSSGEAPQKIPYDLIVGADGVHSCVRDALDIVPNILGQAKGITALIVHDTPIACSMDFSDAIKTSKGFIKRIETPYANIVSMQSDIDLSPEVLGKTAQACGWQIEADAIAQNRAFFVQNIPIVLQQATQFINPQKSGILIGDAAASASFLNGIGVNTALQCAMVAGEFFKAYADNPQTAYQIYQMMVKASTDFLISQSLELFE